MATSVIFVIALVFIVYDKVCKFIEKKEAK